MRALLSLLFSTCAWVASGQIIQDPPAGTVDGVNILSPTSAVFRLRAPGKDHVHLRGDFNDWVIGEDNLMKRSVDGNTHWLAVTGLEPGTWYRYHYLVEEVLEIGDPFAELVVDPWNDPYVPADHWPGMPSYPTGQANWQNAVFRTDEVPFTWTDGAYVRPAQDRLTIYEVLIRDFDGGQTYQDVIDRLDYLQWLGITAIELMPVSEFEGNLSWGYNPNFRFAPDKFYGTAEHLKELVNACHARGMAVILDIVPNHGFGTDPLARLYLDGDGSIAENNPWFNEVAMHPFSPGYDYNHGDPWTREFWKRVFDYWLDEYHIDGYRIDLSKGLTQQFSGSDVGAWNQYDQWRVDVLFEYANHIWSGHPGAFLILEHLGSNAEETVLANGGFMLWGKMTNEYKQATLGYGADLSWGLHTARGWTYPNLVTYFESHDEERLAHELLSFGASSGGYSAAEFGNAMERLALAHAFLFALPGPKMMWQWGEMGYDISIFDCGNGTFEEMCKLDEKPELWGYLDVAERRGLAKKVAALGRLKRDQPAFNGWDFNADLGGALKRIRLYNPNQNAIVLGNFGTTGGTIVPGFPYAGTWYDYFTGESIVENNLDNAWYLAPGELRVLVDTPLPVPDTDGNTPIAFAPGCTDEGATNYNPDADADDGSCVYAVALTVGFAEAPVDPHVAGTFNGWDAGATPLVYDAAADVWSATVELAVGEAIEYKFLAGAEWGTDEAVPAACGVGGEILNRTFELGADLAGPAPVCFGGCVACAVGGCTDVAAVNFEPSAQVDDGTCAFAVVLAVDASELAVDSTGLHVAGNFQGWDAAGTPLVEGEAGIWSVEVIALAGQTLAYKFLNGNTWGLDEAVPAECGTGVDALNRTWTVPLSGGGSPAVPCFGACGPCTHPGSAYCGPGTVWDADLEACIPEGAAPLCVEDLNGDGLVGISDMLQLLSAFGNSCE